MSITVQCQRNDCGETVDIGQETDWTTVVAHYGYDPFLGIGYGPTIAVALPEGWSVDRVGHDEAIHCPEHAG